MFKNKRILGLVLACVLMLLSLGLYMYSLGASSSGSESVQDEPMAKEDEGGSEKAKGSETVKDSDKTSVHEAQTDGAENHVKEQERSKLAGTKQEEHQTTDHESNHENHPPKESSKVAEREAETTGVTRKELNNKEHDSKGQDELEEMDKKSEEFGKKYRPRIIGRCKLLFNQFNLQKLEPNQFHAFAYSFDGKSGYCADSGAQSSLKLAQEVALKDCEKNKENVDGYAPCFIYSNN